MVEISLDQIFAVFLCEICVVWFSPTAAGSLLCSYKRSFNGFAAKVSDSEAQKLASEL